MSTRDPGAWLKRKRIEAGYTKQQTLALALGYKSHGAISNWERGEGSPDPAIVPKLASLLNVTSAEVVERFAIRVPGEMVGEPMPPWAREIINRLDRLETTGQPRPTVARANVAPAPTVTKRRTYWLEMARRRRGWSPAQVDGAMEGRSGAYSRWESGKSQPRGGELRRLAEVLDIPESLITDPPMTDEERLATTHFGDGEAGLRRAI